MDLGPTLRRLGLALRERSGESPVALAPTAAPASAPPPTAGDELEEEREKARRLARIIVSDIVLYNPKKFSDAVQAGNVVDALDDLLEEGRTLFSERVDARIRDEADYLLEELHRVVKQKAGA